MVPIAGHLLPTFALAKCLRARNCDVTYIGFEGGRDLVSREGFRYVSLGSDDEMYAVRHDFQRMRALRGIRRMRALLDRARDEVIGWDADLVLVDSDLPALAGAILAGRAPVWLLHTNFKRFPPTLSQPPSVSSARPSGAFSRLHIGWAWLKAYIVHRVSPVYLMSLIVGPERWIRVAARRYGCKLYSSFSGANLALPSVALCSRTLLFSPYANTRYVRESIDWERAEAAVGIEGPRSQFSILCSLGTNTKDYPWSARFFRAMAQVAKDRPDWTIYLHSAGFTGELNAQGCPGNLVLLEAAPILALLRRVDVMITHAGLGTVKECIAQAVPMVLCPCKWDQHGNAARVASLGLGIVLDARKATPEQIQAGCLGLRRESVAAVFASLKQKAKVDPTIEETAAVLLDAIPPILRASTP